MPSARLIDTTATRAHGHDWGRGPDTGTVDGDPGACPSCAPLRPLHTPAMVDRLVTSPEVAAEVVMPSLAGLDREACVTVALNTRHRVLAVELASLGSLDHTFMAPRELFRLALLANAAALVVAHNHPSGDATPSDDDVRVTTRLARAGSIVGVDLLDHLVVSSGSWTSLARLGHL